MYTRNLGKGSFERKKRNENFHIFCPEQLEAKLELQGVKLIKEIITNASSYMYQV